jgi:hypothetical protein
MSNKLELLMRKAARELRDQQVCVLYKIPEEMQQTPCDFIGYTASGRCIMIECKMVKRPSLPIGKAPGLAAHQWRALDEADRAGCQAMVLWMNGGEFYPIDIRLIRLHMAAGRRSVPWEMGQPMDQLTHHLQRTFAASPRTTGRQ